MHLGTKRVFAYADKLCGGSLRHVPFVKVLVDDSDKARVAFVDSLRHIGASPLHSGDFMPNV